MENKKDDLLNNYLRDLAQCIVYLTFPCYQLSTMGVEPGSCKILHLIPIVIEKLLIPIVIEKLTIFC